VPKAKARTSAAILPYRFMGGRLQVLLVHPGGPFWAKKDLGAWSLAKGEFEPPEDPLDAARREFNEETGFLIDGPLIALTPRKQPSGKTVHAWAVEADYDPAAVRSNTFEMEWPRGSGGRRTFPEIDRAAWFDLEEARRRVLPGHVAFLDELAKRLFPSVSPEPLV
jgi:predicted NUDIX family NTP pyrophosphohydrolase